MPRTYIRKKPELAPVTEQQLARAKELIRNGKSKRAAATAIGISESCLRKRLKLDKPANSMGRFKPTFNDEQEEEFVVHCKKMDERFFGLTINDLRRLAYEYASANNIDNRFDNSSKMAGRDWVACFLKRHAELVIRQSAATSLARAMGFNKVQVDRFYKNLKELYEKYNFQPSRIFNVDETGMSTVPKKTPKVVTTKGKKVVAKVVSAERGVTVTAVCCMSANGQYIPPAFIYPRKRPRDDLLDGGPSQSICMVSDSGFVNTDLFINWLHHFKYFVHPTQEDPVLLILDNHSSHISLEAVKYARENNIVMLTLPPHGSHKLQPLDRCFFSPLKVKYSLECDKFMSQHPGRPITQYHVARLFNEAYKKVATLGNAESGFKVTGIYPYDDDMFEESDFAPSLVTDQIQQEVQQSSNQLLAIDQPEGNDTGEEPSNESQNLPEETDPNSNNESITGKYVPVSDLSPLPRMKEKRCGGKRSISSQVITNSPYKQQLEEKKLQEAEKKISKRKVPALKLTALTKKKTQVSIEKKKGHLYKNKQDPSTSKAKERDYYCPLCLENYKDPPTEEWIKCNACNEWWHEQCTAYERGVFVCDNCIEN